MAKQRSQPMDNPQQQLPEDVYAFVPLTAGAETNRTIALTPPDDQSRRSLPAQQDETVTIEVVASLTDGVDQGDRWGSLVNAVLTPAFLARLTVMLCDRSSLPDLITQQLFQHLFKVYKHKIQHILQSDGLDALDLTRPHLKLIADKSNRPQRMEIVLDDDAICQYLKSSLADFLHHSRFQADHVKPMGTNLVAWALEELKADGVGAVRRTDTSLEQRIQDFLLSPQQADLVIAKLSFFGEIHAADITRSIIEGLNLTNCTLPDLEALLGLKQRPLTPLDAAPDLPAAAPIPTSIPIASSIRAQLRPDLWQQDENEVAVFQYRSKRNPANFIEHYITSPGDIALLPWEAAEQIINKFGFDTVKLQMIFAARTMEQAEPWTSTFRLRASDMIPLLGWDRNHNTTLPEKRSAVASAAYALSCLLVKSVWIEGRGKRKVDASTPVGRMWDVLIDPHGQLDWVTGKIEKPDEVYITVSPGLWTKHFLNRAGSKAKQALHQFGFLARDILQIDPYHHEMALRLAIQLTLDSRVRVHNRNPYDYRVLNLLEEVMPRPEIDKALQDKYKARDLKNRWNKALTLLLSLGWQIEFDPQTYPDWLQPGSKAEKPPDWRKVKLIERLLQAKLTIKPPDPIPDLLSRVKDPKPPKRLESSPVEELTSDQMREGREARGWSRKELAGFLGISADYVGKLERGDRIPPSNLEKQLRRLLQL